MSGADWQYGRRISSGDHGKAVFLPLLLFCRFPCLCLFLVLPVFPAMQTGGDMTGHMMLLAALTLVLLVLSPPVTAAAIRFSEE